MCGITGIFAFNQIGSFYMINLGKATDRLAKRGPDGRGVFLDDFVGLGHRRLSIIDTSYLGNQPMSDETKRYVIVFNGEIFNYRSIKQELEQRGVAFISGSDTEVLLKLYIAEGTRCLDKLIGFFAFAIYDKEEKSLFVARDRMGIKPLYYYHDEDKFIFGSEMKSLLAYNIPKEIDFTSVNNYFQLNYIPGINTIFKNVWKLSPGSYLIIKKKEVKEGSYYDVSYNPDKMTGLDYEDQKKKLVDLLEESVRLRLIADVPLGVFLSGGIDSSVITALAARNKEKIDTFSIGFRDNSFMDETYYAKLVADMFSTNHTVFSLTNEDLEENIFEVLDYLDEPFADSSCIPTYILSKYVRKNVKVALSGDGGDELFAGYQKHRGEYSIRKDKILRTLISGLSPLWKILPKSSSSSWQNKVRQFNKFAEGTNLSVKERYWRWSGHLSFQEAIQLLSPSQNNFNVNEYEFRKNELLKYLKEPGDLNKILRADVGMVLPDDMLVKTDRMSMANGLEVRVPFLDHRVVDFAFSLPEQSKIDHSKKKKIVMDAFRHLLPIELYNRPKKGFDVPLSKIFKRSLKSLIQDELLDKKFIEEQAIFNVSEINKIKQRVFSRDGDFNQEVIWALVVFQFWYRKFMK